MPELEETPTGSWRMPETSYENSMPSSIREEGIIRLPRISHVLDNLIEHDTRMYEEFVEHPQAEAPNILIVIDENGNNLN